MSFSKRTALAATATVTLLSFLVQSASAATPSPFFNGFEIDTSGWFEEADAPGTISRQPSGYADGGYADFIASASGNYHARLGVLDCSTNCPGPYTEWGGSTDTFPPGGFATGLAIYLDVGWAASHPDVRFAWDVAINNAKGEQLRDFAFNAGTLPEGSQPGFLINPSTDAQSEPPKEPVQIEASGWYTFVHEFSDGGEKGLRVDMSILDSSASPVADWTIYPGDPMATVGGNGYGRFSNQEIDELAIDNSSLALIGNTPMPETQTTGGPAESAAAPPGTTATPDCGNQETVAAREEAGIATARHRLRKLSHAVAAAKRKLRGATDEDSGPARKRSLRRARRELRIARSRRKGAATQLRVTRTALANADAALAACNAGLVTEAFATGLSSPGAAPQPPGGSSAALSPPEFGRTVNVQVVSGTVRVKVPGSRRFRVLKASEQIPVGSILDTTNGRVRLTSAKYRGGLATQTADFYAGVFRVRQPPLGRPRTVLKLVDELGGLQLGPARAALASRRRNGGRRSQRNNGLWGNGKGNFVSRGRHGSATVRGTVWFTQDRPDGTFFKVRTDTVLVRDFTRRRTVRLRAGQSYLAPAP